MLLWLLKGPKILGYHLLLKLVAKLSKDNEFLYQIRTGNDIIFNYLFSFLPTNPTSFPWCSIEQEINFGVALPFLSFHSSTATCLHDLLLYVWELCVAICWPSA